jgi:predicted transposase/invertase (TIGR01784 family)
MAEKYINPHTDFDRDIVNAIRTAEKKKYAEGRAEGREEGRAEGEKKAKERIASNLLALGVPIETIMQASGLSEEEIKNIQ